MLLQGQSITTVHYEPVFTEFFYALGPRFDGIKRSQLTQAESYLDLDPQIRERGDIRYTGLRLVMIENDEPTDRQALGENEVFNAEQKQLLASADLSTNFAAFVDFESYNIRSTLWEPNGLSPYFTVVPEQQAAFQFGHGAFLEYLNEKNHSYTANLQEDLLQPSKMYFTVATDGSIHNISIDRSCGYPHIDKHMHELLQATSGHWIPAKDARGALVEQELVVSYGMFGC